MTRHIDLYVAGPGGFQAEWKFACRQFEGEAANVYAATKELPYFNGYCWQTALHEDGECEEYEMKGPVWGPMDNISREEEWMSKDI